MKNLLTKINNSRYFDGLLPVFAAFAALAVGAVMLLFLGINPLVAYPAMFMGAFGSSNALAETTVKAVPLLLIGLGICISFRAKVINIGGEGQMIIGGLAGTALGLALDLPGWLVIPMAMLAGFLGGALWGAIPGVLKAYFNVNEILSTVMMNAIAVQLMNFFLRGPMIDPAQAELLSKIPQTARLPDAYHLARWLPTRLHAGVLIALVLAFVVYLLLFHTTLGYRIRAVGFNPDAARYGGIRVRRQIVIALLLSGAFAGLAGAIQVYGLNYRMITDGSATGFTGSAGFNGIVTALFGGLHPLGTIPASFFFGALLVGANSMQRISQVPSAFVIALNGLVVIFVVSAAYWQDMRQRKRRLDEVRDEQVPPPPPAQVKLEAEA
ncbi:MAG: ABC transporter permease [Anaerolineales bacterium]|jgi:simple sugar transport system permease protein|nr:ABC transporter permease [Anaerolineales bacterium]